MEYFRPLPMSAPGDFSPEIESPSCNKNRPRSRYRIAAWNEIAPTVYSVQRPLERGHDAHTTVGTTVGLGGFVHGRFNHLHNLSLTCRAVVLVPSRQALKRHGSCR